ncbi:AAA family ATPase [Pseudomonas sp. BN515]|uniref:AAA family ATPase n=1 Tax=Pseudomonas sp. BN515 TaxID=2567892 RepID=UPI002455E8A7|nr:AAA family ATPase [Pseudomonas sp. BN515]MDH4872802.1 adenylyl-sulfate kinase [Pseudomonas sp. BN515]
MLIVFSGLPGAGKTTIASALVSKTRALYLRIDTIEQALRNSSALGQDVGRSGYVIANELALSNLRFGSTVIVDCVNPVAESRNAWSEIAARAGVSLVNVEVVCSDKREHQRRVETRNIDVPGLIPPTWQSVLSHDYEEWDRPAIRIDTAGVSADEAAAMLTEQLFRQTVQW